MKVGSCNHTQYRVGRPDLDEILSGETEVEAIAEAYRVHGYTMREIADFLGIHYSSVSRRVLRHEQGALDCAT